MKYIVASGKKYTDIDALACICSYAQLLQLKKIDACGISTVPWNQTITDQIKKWPIEIEKKYIKPKGDYGFIIVDLSDPEFIEEFVTIDRVHEVYDHHYGFEKYWHDRLPNDSHIKNIGACATMIWQKIKESNLEKHLSKTNYNLLYTAIFANTLDFKSSVTTSHDISAAKELEAFITVPRDWKKQYYQDILYGFSNNLMMHVHNDTKIISLDGSQFYFGQIELWNAQNILSIFDQEFTHEKGTEWLLNIVSIAEGRSYLFINSERLKIKLFDAINMQSMNNDFYVCDQLWLRKEILKKLFRF